MLDILKSLLGSGSFVATALTGILLGFAKTAGLNLDHDQVLGIVTALVAFLLARLGKTALNNAQNSIPVAAHLQSVSVAASSWPQPVVVPSPQTLPPNGTVLPPVAQPPQSINVGG